VKLIAVLVIVLAFCAPAAARKALVIPVADQGSVRAWSPQFFDRKESLSLEGAREVARRFDVVVALPTVFRAPQVAAMKAANPRLTLFLYMKGVFTYDTGLPEQAYAHDALGLRIQGLQYPGTWLLDPTSPRAYAYDLDRAGSLLAASGYDGVFLDTIGSAPLGAGYVSGSPIDPATGRAWTAAGWLGATSALAGRLAGALGRPTIGNGLHDGSAYFDRTAPTSILLRTGMDGAMAECWLRGAGDGIGAYPTEATWKQDVDAIADAETFGAAFLAVTKVWTDGTKAQKDAWYTFAAASYLLASDGSAYLAVSAAPGDSTARPALADLDLGTPRGPYAKVQGVYQREFSAGRVLVNPGNATVVVRLANTYHSLDGAPTTIVTLPPHSARILTR
jgi:hypothetical protein